MPKMKIGYTIRDKKAQNYDGIAIKRELQKNAQKRTKKQKNYVRAHNRMMMKERTKS